MPWCQKARKGVVNCDKLRLVVSKLRPGDTRIGQPDRGHSLSLVSEYIGCESKLGEVNHLSTPRKRKRIDLVYARSAIPQVAASEKGIAQTSYT